MAPPRRTLGAHESGAVIGEALVVLDADEVVAAGELEPALVDLGALAVAHARIVTDDDVVDEGEGQPDREAGGRDP
jgi:hypothetical protein